MTERTIGIGILGAANIAERAIVEAAATATPEIAIHSAQANNFAPPSETS